MAVQVMVAVYDRVAGFYQHPFFTPSKGVATRAFADQINRSDEQNQFFKHASDFDLYYLGLYDDNSGQFELQTPPELILSGAAAKTS